MADVFLLSIVDSILEHLAYLHSQEVGQALCVKKELQKLQNTFLDIAAMLQEAAKREIESYVMKCWLEELKDVVYDTDDLLDDFSTQTLRRRGVTGGDKRARNEVCTFFSSSNQIVYPRVMARRIKGIREIIDAISKDRILFQLEGNTSTILESLVENRVWRETYAFEYTPQVFGREEEKKEVIEFLMNPDFEENVSVLSIVGVGGIGKTTLAKLVFNDEIVKSHFMLRLWVCVSEDFHVENILRKRVKECTQDMELANLDTDEMQKRIGEELDEKRFLLVLDDVWNENRRAWLELQGFLTNGAKGSKILVTTRSLRVAETMDAKVHVLSGLDGDLSLSLLMLMALKEEHEWRGKSLELIAKEILRKCGGNPLAIVTIGRLLLFSRNTEEDWMAFKNTDLSRLYGEEGDIMPSLKLSYDVLPTHLKGCFAYCGLFPKDCELDPSELIHLWIAQGYVKSTGNKKTLEEVGQEYFEELVSRSFFQHDSRDIFGNIIGCKMHNLMHDLAVSVMGDNCIGSSSDLTHYLEARHVSMVDLGDYELKRFEMNRRIRSLLLTRIKASDLDISRFENLRALHLHGNINEIPRSIGKLKHMRSLDLSENEMLRSLPNSMSKLYNLETLNLMKCYNLERLPRGITKLVNLRKLDVRGCNKLTHMPRGIGKLTNLQMLHRFVVGERGNRKAARLHELSRLTGLREGMVIGHLERLKSISTEVDAPLSMEKFSLQCLELQWEFVDKEYTVDHKEVLDRLVPHPDLKALGIEGYGGTGLSSWISQLDKLVKINISYCNQCTRLPPMDHLHFLKMISLNELRELEWIELSKNGTPQHSFFRSLEVLEFKCLVNFKGWERRRANVKRIEEQEEEIQDDEVSSSLCMLPAFSDKIKLTIEYCPKFSYMHGQERLQLEGTTSKILQELSRNSTRAVSNPSMMMFISISSISISALTSLSFYEIMDVKHLPVELFPCIQNLRSLIISRCPRLESLCISAIFRYLIALEILEIRDFPLLDLSIDHSNGGKDMDILQTHGHCKLNRLTVKGILKMESLPVWFLYLPNLKSLEISFCFSLKSLPRGLIPRLLTTLESLVLKYCPELDLTGDSKDQEDNLSTKLRELELCFIQKMKHLPWWIQHLTNLESLKLDNCNNLEGFPACFPELTSLKSLRVDNCSGLKSLPGKLILRLPITLDSLLLSRCPELDLTEELVEGRFKLSRLEFGSMEKMKTLPWSLQYLTKLKSLKLVGCRNLEALPEWFHRLKSLKSLTILDCGELSRRYKNTEEDWSKISHIQYVYIDQ